jgi:hypothetical protein
MSLQDGIMRAKNINLTPNPSPMERGVIVVAQTLLPASQSCL